MFNAAEVAIAEDVGDAVGLSADKSNQLIELLAEQQTRNMGRPPQPADGQSMQQYFTDMQKKNQSEVVALIGACLPPRSRAGKEARGSPLRGGCIGNWIFV